MENNKKIDSKIIVALITVAGGIIAASIGYLSDRNNTKMIMNSTQTAEAVQISVLSTSDANPTETLAPTVTLTAVPTFTATVPATTVPKPESSLPDIPGGYVVYDDFNAEFNEAALWAKDGTLDACSGTRENDLLHLKCTPANEDVRIDYSMPSQRSKEITGAAIACKLSGDSPMNSLTFILNLLLDPADNGTYRRYGLVLKSSEIEILEVFPYQNWTYNVLGTIEVSPTQIHTLQFEIIEKKLMAVVDGNTADAITMAELPEGFQIEYWQFEVFAAGSSAPAAEVLDAEIYWAAIKE